LLDLIRDVIDTNTYDYILSVCPRVWQSGKAVDHTYELLQLACFQKNQGQLVLNITGYDVCDRKLLQRELALRGLQWRVDRVLRGCED